MHLTVYSGKRGKQDLNHCSAQKFSDILKNFLQSLVIIFKQLSNNNKWNWFGHTIFRSTEDIANKGFVNLLIEMCPLSWIYL